MKSRKSKKKSKGNWIIKIIIIWPILLFISIIFGIKVEPEQIETATVIETREKTLKVESGETFGDKNIYEIKKPLFTSPKKGDKIHISTKNNEKANYKYTTIPISILPMIILFIPLAVLGAYITIFCIYIMGWYIITSIIDLIKKINFFKSKS